MPKHPVTKLRAIAGRAQRQAEPGTEAGAGPQFGQVRTRRVFEEICEQVRREMGAGTLRPGDKLPAERDLAVKFGVSRSAVREALRSLEIAGVVGLQKGAKGGAFILQGDPELFTRLMRDLYVLGRISLDSLTEARTLIMQTAVGLVAERITPQIVAALEANNEQLARLPRSGTAANRVAISAQFYSLLAEATRNEVLQAIIESLSAIVLQQVTDTRSTTLPDLIGHRQRLVRLLARGDADGARREITEHLQRLHKHLLREERLAARRRADARQTVPAK